jgi:Fur family transcriptional regulator, ferric uptake regulator
MRAFRSSESAGHTAGSAANGDEPQKDVTERALARFKAVLTASGSRLSSVREAIARVVLELRGHFEANDIVRELRTRNVRDAHLATVYRTLPLLVRAGLIQPALFSSGERAFYEASFERPHHDHLICTGCGVVVEFELEAIEALQRDLARCHGFELTAHYHELLGECTSCRTAGPSSLAPAHDD